MSDDWDDTNTGAMFKNERKRTDRHPDRTGSAIVECPDCGAKTEFWVSGWLKKAKRTGQQFLSLAFTAKEEETQTQGPTDGAEEDIPF